MPADFDRIAIIGVGLIGGSVALAARQRGHAVKGFARSEASRQRALEAGVVAEATIDLAEAVADADLVLACTPVGQIAPSLIAAAGHCPAGAVLTDVGSTKQAIVRDVEAGLSQRPTGAAFVGSHPLAGDHRTGPEFARADLLAGRCVVVTPTDATLPGSADRVSEFWESLGADVTQMPAAAHDAALAQTSHLPHVVAAALAGTTPHEVLPLAATGWRDTTRVAAGASALWRDILMTNRPPLEASLSALADRLEAFRQALAAGDAAAVEQLLEQGRQSREAVGD